MAKQKVSFWKLIPVLITGSMIGISFFILAPFIGILIISYIMMGEMYYVVAYR